MIGKNPDSVGRPACANINAVWPEETESTPIFYGSLRIYILLPQERRDSGIISTIRCTSQFIIYFIGDVLRLVLHSALAHPWGGIIKSQRSNGGTHQVMVCHGLIDSHCCFKNLISLLFSSLSRTITYLISGVFRNEKGKRKERNEKKRKKETKRRKETKKKKEKEEKGKKMSATSSTLHEMMEHERILRMHYSKLRRVRPSLSTRLNKQTSKQRRNLKMHRRRVKEKRAQFVRLVSERRRKWMVNPSQYYAPDGGLSRLESEFAAEISPRGLYRQGRRQRPRVEEEGNREHEQEDPRVDDYRSKRQSHHRAFLRLVIRPRLQTTAKR